LAGGTDIAIVFRLVSKTLWTIERAVLSVDAVASHAYRDFLTLWKDADPDISILKQAEAEYAKLQ